MRSLRLHVAERLDMAREIGRMPGHQDHRRRRESLDQHAAFAVDRRRERTADPRRRPAPSASLPRRRSAPARPRCRRSRRASRTEARARADGGEPRLIDMRQNASDPFAIPAGQKLLGLDQLEMRIEHMAVQRPALHVERRREARHSRIEQDAGAYYMSKTRTGLWPGPRRFAPCRNLTCPMSIKAS